MLTLKGGRKFYYFEFSVSFYLKSTFFKNNNSFKLGNMNKFFKVHVFHYQ